MRGRPILAGIFVVALGFVLSIPLRGTGDGQPTSVRDPKATPTSESQPTPDETSPPKEAKLVDKTELTGAYPEECLEPVTEPGGDGLLAIDQGRGIEITDTSGAEPVLIDDSFPFKWSPSGGYLMAGSGTIYDETGDEVATLSSSDGLSWAWSPIADCLVFSDGDGLSVLVPGSDPAPLHEGPISRFSFSPSGGDLAYYTDGGPEKKESSLWVASLAGDVSRRITTIGVPTQDEVLLAGWTPSGSHVLFWTGPSDLLLRDGKALLAASAEGKVQEAGLVLAHRDFLTACGKDLLGVIGGGARVEPNEKRLAILKPGRDPEFLTPSGNHEVSPSCSPDEEFIATIRSASATGDASGRLTIIDRTGSVELTTQDSGYEDAYPLWGRGDAGVLFVRDPSGRGSDPELWHVSTTSSPQPIGVTLRRVTRDPAIFRDSWGHWLDWSADLPSGLSVISGAS